MALLQRIHVGHSFRDVGAGPYVSFNIEIHVCAGKYGQHHKKTDVVCTSRSKAQSVVCCVRVHLTSLQKEISILGAVRSCIIWRFKSSKKQALAFSMHRRHYKGRMTRWDRNLTFLCRHDALDIQLWGHVLPVNDDCLYRVQRLHALNSCNCSDNILPICNCHCVQSFFTCETISSPPSDSVNLAHRGPVGCRHPKAIESRPNRPKKQVIVLKSHIHEIFPKHMTLCSTTRHVDCLFQITMSIYQ